MADVKISALPAATTPLTGGEVLPIVQSSTTKQVAVSNLTAGLTGTASININGTVGATTPSTGAFTTLSATGITTVAAGSAALPAIVSTTGTADTGLWFPAADTVAASTAGAERLRIDSSGNVGIGTTAPSALLDLQSSGTTQLEITSTGASGNQWALSSRADGTFRIADDSATLFRFTIDENGNVGIGTTTPSALLDLQSSGTTQLELTSTGASGNMYVLSSRADGTFRIADDSAGATRLIIDENGIFTMSAYGAGAATFSAAGVISSVSDETWKTKDGIPADPDAMLNKLEPGYWYYNDEKKDTFGAERQLGFYAQNVNAAIGPEAAPEPETVVTKNDDGTETSVTKPWGYYDRSVLAVTVMSLQKALATIESLTARITALEAK